MIRVLGVAFLAAASLWGADPVRDERWRADLRFLAAELPSRHVNLFARMTRQDFDRAVSDLNQAIPDLGDAEVIVGLARIVALAGDAHTSLRLPQAAAPFRAVGLRLYWFDEGLYVTAAGPEYSRALGARVVRIGDMDIDAAYRAVSAVISHENDFWVRHVSESYLTIPEIMRALKVAPDGQTVRYTFVDNLGASFSLDGAPQAVSAALPDPLLGFTPLYQQRANQAYWFQYLDASKTLYFKYNMAVEPPGQPFTEFARQLFATIDSNPVERVVFDVRNNTGGSSAIIDPFLQGVRQRGGRFRLFVITGRQTISSGMLAAVAAKDLPNVMLLGEPTGGKPNHYGNLGPDLVLPNSRLVVNYSIKVFAFPGLNGDALDPDLPLPVSAADYFARHDLFLAVALALERDCACDLAAPPGPIAVVNAASFRTQTAVAPGALVSAFGNFAGAPAADARSIPLPRQLGDVQVLINATAAPLVAVRPRQINFQMPRAAPAGYAVVRVTLAGREIAAGTVAVASADPGIFVLDPQSWTKPGAVLNQDFRVNGAAARARPGEVIQIFGTGSGAFDPSVEDGVAPQALSQTKLLPRVLVGAEEAAVLFSGASPEFPGLWQINARIPSKATILGQMPVFVVLGGAPSNSATIWVAEPLP